MVENTPRCRLCGYQLKSDSGCDICIPVKKVLVWPVISDESSEYSAASVINETLRALKRRLKRLNREITREATSDYDPRLTRDLTAVGRTLKELAAEQRKLEDREDEHYANLGIDGRIDIYVNEFFLKLPEDKQVQLLSEMRDGYNAQNASLLPESNDE